MIDDRLYRAFGTLDAPLDPDPTFATRLFEELAGDLGFRPDRPVGIGRRVRRVLGLERPPVGAQALRLAYLAAVIGLLLALAIGAALIASLLEQRPSPSELVRLSQAAYDHPPAFVATFTDAQGIEHRLSSDGAGTWRIDTSTGVSDSDYDLYDGTRFGHYDAQGRLWASGTVATAGGGVPPFPFQGEFTWMTNKAGTGPVFYRLACASPQPLDDAVVAGRSTDHLICSDTNMQFWLDRSTHLILKIEAGEGTPNWTAGAGMEVTSITFAAPTDPALFSWSGPPGAFDAASPPASSVLRVGQPPPRWTGRSLDGQSFDTSTMRLPAALYLFAPWCPPCTDSMYGDVAAAAVRHPSVDGVFVGVSDSLGTVVGYVHEHPPGVPVVDGTGDTIVKAWGLEGFPTLVLIGSDGNVAGVYLGVVGRADLDALLGALSAGTSLPSPAPTPSPSLEPSVAPLSPGAPEPVTGLSVGDELPAWSGPLLAGGRLESATLVGKPTIIWFWPGGTCSNSSNCPTTDLETFARDVAPLLARLNVVVVSGGEPTPGWTKDLFAKLGIHVPLVFDWDAVIFRTLKMDAYGTLAADPSGRLLEASPGPLGGSELARIVDRFPVPSSGAP